MSAGDPPQQCQECAGGIAQGPTGSGYSHRADCSQLLLAPPPTYSALPEIAYVIRWLKYLKDPEKCFLGIDARYGVTDVVKEEAKRFASRDDARKFIHDRVMRPLAVSKQNWVSFCKIEEA